MKGLEFEAVGIYGLEENQDKRPPKKEQEKGKGKKLLRSDEALKGSSKASWNSHYEIDMDGMWRLGTRQ